MTLDHGWIAAHIPHHGSMCLLDSVELWNTDRITCRASSHRKVDNPLRAGGRLGIATGIEFAAQAMAVHGALLAADDAPPAVGFLTSVRDVQWHRSRLDDLAGDLTVHAERISGNDTSLLYRFDLQASGEVVLSGRASVMIKVPEV